MTSGQPVAVPHTPSAASITAILPMASLREQSQTERTFASPSLYLIRINTLAALTARARNADQPHHLGTWSAENEDVPHRCAHTQRPMSASVAPLISATVDRTRNERPMTARLIP